MPVAAGEAQACRHAVELLLPPTWELVLLRVSWWWAQWGRAVRSQSIFLLLEAAAA